MMADQSMRWRVAVAVMMAMGFASPAVAVPTRAVREAVEYVMRKFASELGEESAETLSARLARLAERQGDEAITAFRKIGPRALRVVEEAGEHAGTAVKLLAKYGDEALWVVGCPERLRLAARYGDDAVEAMIRHKGLAEPLIRRFHASAAKALAALTGRNARRVAMMADDGTLAAMGKADALLAVIGRYGDRAADFIWRHKGALTVAAVLTAFLDDPEPFIEGTRELAGVATQPVAEALVTTARESVRRTNWTAVWIGILVLVGLLLMVRSLRVQRTAR